MKPVYHVTLDCTDRTNPAYRVMLQVVGLTRKEAIQFAEETMLKTGSVYKLAYVIAGWSWGS